MLRARCCRITIAPYNTHVSSIAFSFTEFAPTNGTGGAVAMGRVQYFWGLGTEAGLDNVLAGNVGSPPTEPPSVCTPAPYLSRHVH